MSGYSNILYDSALYSLNRLNIVLYRGNNIKDLKLLLKVRPWLSSKIMCELCLQKMTFSGHGEVPELINNKSCREGRRTSAGTGRYQLLHIFSQAYLV